MLRTSSIHLIKQCMLPPKQVSDIAFSITCREHTSRCHRRGLIVRTVIFSHQVLRPCHRQLSDHFHPTLQSSEPTLSAADPCEFLAAFSATPVLFSAVSLLFLATLQTTFLIAFLMTWLATA